MDCPPSIAYANSVDVPYIPMPKGRGFTAHVVTNNIGTTYTAEGSGSRTKVITLGIDAGKTLSAGLGEDNKPAYDGITVADGYTLHVLGQAGDTSVETIKNFKTALTNNSGGTLDVQNIKFENNTTDIINNGIAALSSVTGNNVINNSAMSMSGTSTFGTISGTGTTEITDGSTTVSGNFTQSGLTVGSNVTFEINGASTINGAVANSGTMTINSDFTATSLANSGTYTQTAGNFVVNGDVTNNGTVLLQNLEGTETADITKAENKVTGNLTNQENRANKSNTNLFSAAASFATIEANDIRKRLGDVRLSNAKDGTWFRYEKGALSGM